MTIVMTATRIHACGPVSLGTMAPSDFTLCAIGLT